MECNGFRFGERRQSYGVSPMIAVARVTVPCGARQTLAKSQYERPGAPWRYGLGVGIMAFSLGESRWPGNGP